MRDMIRGRKLTFAAGAAGVALLVAGLGAAGAIAASRVFSPSEESKAVIDDAAAQLGVDPSALSDALKKALENRVDDAVAAGRITKEQGERLKAQIESNEYPFLFGFHGPRGPEGFGPGQDGGPFEIVATAASYLGMTEAELRQALADKTLAQIAKEKGKTVSGLVQALVNAQEKRIDEAVADGRLTQEQANALEADLTERMQQLVNGELRRPDRGLHPRFWPGSGSPRAPPAFGGPSA
jgi:polyhydroxyalkanoate synthesis regulator phasin